MKRFFYASAFTIALSAILPSGVLALEQQGLVFKKSVSFAYRSVDGDLSGSQGTSRKDLTLFGARTEFLLKLNEAYNHAWFGGIGFAVLKGKFEQSLVSSVLSSAGSGNVDSAFEFNLFAESDLLFNDRWAMLTRFGLALAIFNQGADKNAAAAAADLALSAGDGTLEVFAGVGLSYAINEKASLSTLLRFSLADLTSWTDLDYDEIDYRIYGLQFSYSF